MVLEKLGSSLYSSLKRVLGASVVDEAVVKELTRDIQRALLQGDVNVSLVLEISGRIEKHSLEEKLPKGISRKEHVVKVVFEELTRFLGEKPSALSIITGQRNIFMLVGIQGSGKTTSSAKIARYLQKRGFKTSLICTDTYRPGALVQLTQLLHKTNIPIYGDEEEKNPIKIALSGLEKFKDYDIVIVDTAGRHKDEKGLIEEMEKLWKSINPDEVILVIDSTIGQQAANQARAFNQATPIGSILVAKLDGAARGGGALSAVAATGAHIKLIGTGESINDLEVFDPPRFVGRLLGMGDIQSLVDKVREAEIKMPDKKAKEMLSGRFTLSDMYEQFQAMHSMGPLNRILGMIPGFSYEIPKDQLEIAESQIKKWEFIIQSMTPQEREDPKIIKSSRIRRVARGSGTTEKEVKALLKQFEMMRKMMRNFRRKTKLPFFGKKSPF